MRRKESPRGYQKEKQVGKKQKCRDESSWKKSGRIKGKDVLWGKSQTKKETKGKNQTPKKQDIKRKVLPRDENKKK